MTPTPSYRRKRRALAQQLRHLREQAGLSGNQFAKNVGWAQSKVSRIETAAQVPSESDLATWSNALAIPKGEYGSLLLLLEQAEAEYGSWRANFRTSGGAKRKQDEFRQLEAATKNLQELHLCLMPGLLQTYDYAAAVLKAEFGPMQFGADNADVEETISMRMQRQSVLYDAQKSLSFIVLEACLWTRIANQQIQIGQIQRLIDLSAMPNIRIGIIPFSERVPIIPLSGFTIFDDEMVLIETLSGEQQLAASDDIRLYSDAFSACESVTLTGGSAIDLLRSVKDQIS